MSTPPVNLESYGAKGGVIQSVPPPIQAATAPTTANRNYTPGQVWIDYVGQTASIFIGRNAATGVWATMGSVGGPLETLTGDSGGAISPVTNNIDILGTALQISVVGTSGTLTVSIPPTFSIGSTSAANGGTISVGTGNFLLQGAATSTITIGTGLTSGTILIGGTAETGTITVGSSTGTNIVAIGAGTGATTVNIATGATNAKAVNIATGAVANVVIIGSVSGAASMSLLVGTGNFALNGAATSTYTIGAATTSGTISIGGTAQTGTMTLAGGTGIQTINIANSTGVKTINIGTGAAANVITIGTTNTTASLTLQAGSGNVNVAGNLALTSVATQILMNGGAVTDFIGTAVLVAGTVTVANTNIAAADRVMYARSTTGGTEGHLSYVITAGQDIVFTSSSATDTSTIAYVIFRQT